MDVKTTIEYLKFLKRWDEILDSTESDFSAQSLETMNVEEKIEAFQTYIYVPYVSFAYESQLYYKDVILQDFLLGIESWGMSLKPDAIFDFFNATYSTFCESFLAQSKYSRAAIKKIMEALKNNDSELFITEIEASDENCNLLGKICAKAQAFHIGIDVSSCGGVPCLPHKSEDPEQDYLLRMCVLQDLQSRLEAIKGLRLNCGCEDVFQLLFLSCPDIECDLDTWADWFYNNYLLFAYLFMYFRYSDLIQSGNKKEAKNIKRILLHPAASEMLRKARELDATMFTFDLVSVPKDIFDKPVEDNESEYFCDLKPQFIAGGSDKLIAVVNPLNSTTVVNNEDTLVLQTLIFRFTGRLRPQVLSLPQIAVKPENALYIYYVVKNIVSDDTNLFSKIKSFFRGHNLPENESDLNLDNLPDDFRDYYDTLYSDVIAEEDAENDFGSENEVELKLPSNFFALKPHTDRSEYFGGSNFIAGTDIEKFTELLNWLGEKGYIENDFRTKRLLAYRLTGRWRPEGKLPKIKWMGKGAKGSNCIYLVSKACEDKKKKFDKMQEFFDRDFPKNNINAYARSSGKPFRKSLNEFFPKIFTLKPGDEF